MNYRKLQNKANDLGYSVRKGCRRYLYNNAVVRDDKGNLIPGYEVINNTTGLYEWGCYNNTFTHLWSIEDVYNFLKAKGLKA